MLTAAPSSSDKEALAKSVNDRLWRYLSAHADTLNLAPALESLFRLPRGEARRLAAAHLALSPATSEMLLAARRLLRELPSSIARTEIEADGAIRPPVAWASTLLTRRRTGRAAAIICKPPERQYDTSLARLLKLALTQCGQLSEIAALGAKGHVGATIEDRSESARRLLRHVKLEQVRLARHLPSSTARLAARHSASAIPEFAGLFADAIDNQAPAVMRQVISAQLLAPAEIDRLFELYVGFELTDGLIETGFKDTSVRLLPGRQAPFARLRQGTSELEIWWQQPIWASFPALREQSAYLQTLKRAGVLNPRSLRPDFLITDKDRQRVLIVEVKHTILEGETPERQGVQNALAYLKDSDAVVKDRPAPHALVAAWNATGEPATDQIVVCDQHKIRQAIQLIVNEWSSAAS